MINFNSFPKAYNKFATDLQPSYQAQGGQKIASSLAQDTFVKSVAAAKTNETALDDKKIEQIYNNVYQNVINMVPITKELTIAKPSLVFLTPTDTEALASYGFYDNKIAINTIYEQDYYLCTKKNENSEIEDVNIIPQSFAFDDKYSNYEKTKLNNAEKELFVASNLAHELRHCIQSHLIASTKNCRKAYVKNIESKVAELKEANLHLIELQKELAQLNNTTPDIKEYEEKIKSYNYATDYKPKKILTDDSLLKFSMLADDKRYWSTKNHLFANNISSSSQDIKEYYSNPLEIDAFNFAAEYLALSKPDLKDVRDEVYKAMQMTCLMGSAFEANLTGKYPPFVEKTR